MPGQGDAPASRELLTQGYEAARTHACSRSGPGSAPMGARSAHTCTLCTCTLRTHACTLCTRTHALHTYARSAHAPNPDAPLRAPWWQGAGRQDAARGAGTDLGCGTAAVAAAGRRRMLWLARRGFVRAFMRARCSSCLACSCRGLSSSSCPGTKALRPRSGEGD